MQTCQYCGKTIKAWSNDRGILIQKAVGLVEVSETGIPAEHPIKSEPTTCACPQTLE